MSLLGFQWKNQGLFFITPYTMMGRKVYNLTLFKIKTELAIKMIASIIHEKKCISTCHRFQKVLL